MEKQRNEVGEYDIKVQLSAVAVDSPLWQVQVAAQISCQGSIPSEAAYFVECAERCYPYMSNSFIDQQCGSVISSVVPRSVLWCCCCSCSVLLVCVTCLYWFCWFVLFVLLSICRVGYCNPSQKVGNSSIQCSSFSIFIEPLCYWLSSWDVTLYFLALFKIKINFQKKQKNELRIFKHRFSELCSFLRDCKPPKCLFYYISL